MQFNTTIIHDYTLSIALPKNYDATLSYPTIYMQDGGNGARQAWNYIDHLILSKQIQPFILIAIEPINRNNDYTPWPAEPFASHLPKMGGKLTDYLTILTNEIKPYIDTHYATNPAADYTTIAGCSFGGLATIFASYYFPEVFGNYISLSASFWYQDVVNFLQGKPIILENETILKKPHVNRERHRLYGYVGELEGIYHQTTQKAMYPLTKTAYTAIYEEGFTPDSLLFETNPEGTHDSYFFTVHFLRALTWLFGNN